MLLGAACAELCDDVCGCGLCVCVFVCISDLFLAFILYFCVLCVMCCVSCMCVLCLCVLCVLACLCVCVFVRFVVYCDVG